MKVKDIKLELFYFRKALFQYKRPFKYLKNKYSLAPRILSQEEIFEKPINQPDLSMHVLTRQRDLIMLIWSLTSFYKLAGISGELYIHSDGSLGSYDKGILYKFFPSAKIIEPQYLLKRHMHQLAQFLQLRKFRENYSKFILLLKLIDPYFISDKPRHLIIDSDLVWFKKPVIIQENIKTSKSFMMQGLVDGSGNYVYFKDKTRLDNKLANYNSGIVLYSKDNFNLEKLTDYLEKIDIEHKRNLHFIEQAAYASCLDKLEGLPQDKYAIKEYVNAKTVMRHYTAPRRPLFYIEGLDFLKNLLLKN
jgi:hypothetical protein